AHIGVNDPPNNDTTWTILFRIRITSLPSGSGGDTFDTLINLFGTQGGAYNCVAAVQPNGTCILQYIANGTPSGADITTATLGVGEAHLLAMTYNSSTKAVVLYIDGEEEASLTATSANMYDIGLLGWGAVSDVAHARIQGVKLWQAVLSQEEIAAEWDTIAPVRTDDL